MKRLHPLPALLLVGLMPSPPRPRAPPPQISELSIPSAQPPPARLRQPPSRPRLRPRLIPLAAAHRVRGASAHSVHRPPLCRAASMLLALHLHPPLLRPRPLSTPSPRPPGHRRHRHRWASQEGEGGFRISSLPRLPPTQHPWPSSNWPHPRQSPSLWQWRLWCPPPPPRTSLPSMRWLMTCWHSTCRNSNPPSPRPTPSTRHRRRVRHRAIPRAILKATRTATAVTTPTTQPLRDTQATPRSSSSRDTDMPPSSSSPDMGTHPSSSSSSHMATHHSSSRDTASPPLHMEPLPPTATPPRHIPLPPPPLRRRTTLLRP
mmetsp:Transcript_9715/g.21586  ORF Transcript_9715/g.21586 Transcript_9715/m.21586 type:complete len:318 (-) Transcript_9715:254-1207(-)